MQTGARMTDKLARLNANVKGQEAELELPVYKGTYGPDVIDVRALTKSGKAGCSPTTLASYPQHPANPELLS